MRSIPTARYAELRCRTNFSFLSGASHAAELIERAAELGYAALAVTDAATLAGIVRAHVAAKEKGMKLVIGAELGVEDAPSVLLYAPDRGAYGRLSRLITCGRRAAKKGSCRLTLADVAGHADGLLAVVVPPANVPEPDALAQLQGYRDLFPGRCYLAAALHLGPDDGAELDRLAALGRKARLPLVATNDVHYHDPSRRPLQDVLTAIRHRTSVARLGDRRFPNGERCLQPPAEMARRFARYPVAIENALEIADRCTFSLDELRYEYPDEISPPGLTPTAYLDRLTWEGARTRYPEGVPAKVADLLRRELALIAELRYESFFLTVQDIICFARARGILCQGRGSAANSAVCYCLGITAVDPGRSDVLFERFVSRERDEPPDIDVDFEHERREEVLQYVYAKYGRDRAGIAAEVICYRPRSAVRDVGKALGFSQDRVDRLSKTLDHVEDADGMTARLREAGLTPDAPKVRQLLRLAAEVIGFPRHLSQHVGGFVITRGPLSELVPIENAAMPDRTIVQWDKDDLDALGILKVDCLGLGMLTCIRKSFELIERHHGRPLSLATVPAEDAAVYDMICAADTVGVFQIESRAQMSMLPRLRPRCFYDLVVEVAIVRPGPIQGDMVHPYLRRRAGLEAVTYPTPEVAEVLGKTLGVPLFQEQVMRLAMVAAGFSAGEADQLRRAMGSWRGAGVIERFRAKLRDGMRARGLPPAFTDRLFEQIKGFGEYGFPESHAASFALLAYASAWLKCHYPAAFACALLNSQPMGFYAAAQIVADVQRHGVTVLPVDVRQSDWDSTLEDGPALRLGFRLLRGFSEAAATALVDARQTSPFDHSLHDLRRRSGVPRHALMRLAAAGAFASLGLDRRAALWQVLATGEDLPLFAGLDDDMDIPPLPGLDLREEIAADYDAVGLSLTAHPLSILRAALDTADVVPAARLSAAKDKATVRVAGLVIMRQQPPTAKGTVFLTLEDEGGSINLIVWKRVWERYRQIARNAVALLVEGEVQRATGVVHVCAARFEDLSRFLTRLPVRSRDFH